MCAKPRAWRARAQCDASNFGEHQSWHVSSATSSSAPFSHAQNAHALHLHAAQWSPLYAAWQYDWQSR